MKCQGFRRSLALWENDLEAVALKVGDKEQGSRWGHRHSCHHNSRPEMQDSNRGGGRSLPCRLKTVVQGRGGGLPSWPGGFRLWAPVTASSSTSPWPAWKRGRREFAGEFMPKPCHTSLLLISHQPALSHMVPPDPREPGGVFYWVAPCPGII